MLEIILLVAIAYVAVAVGIGHALERMGGGTVSWGDE